MKVLKKKSQISEARQELIAEGSSFLDNPLRSILRRIGVSGGVSIGDWVKSWDVLETLKFIETNLAKDDPILDIGCYASEVPVALHVKGYSRISGADLDPELKRMPYSESINYVNTDFMRTPFDDASFNAITSISVIEHGYNGEALLTEMARLLKPGGYFIASFDYWPDKIDTNGVKFFGMDWQIFSRQDVAELVEIAARSGLYPVGEMSYDAGDKIIDCAGERYTFAWLVLEKTE